MSNGVKTIQNFVTTNIDKILAIKNIGWIISGIAIVGAICNANALIVGFFLWIIANTLLAILNWKKKDYAQVTLWIAYDIIAIWGIIVWAHKGI